MISKTNSSPSFGMAFRQEKMLDVLSPLKKNALGTFGDYAAKINKYSDKHNVDVYMKSVTKPVEEAAEGAAEDAEPIVREVIDKIVVTLQGKPKTAAKGEEVAEVLNRTLEYDIEEIFKKPRQIKKFFRGLKKEVAKTGILSKIKNNFGI